MPALPAPTTVRAIPRPHSLDPSSTSAMRVLALTAWYPTADQPNLGVFVVEQMRAVAAHADVELVHLSGVRDLLHPGAEVRSAPLGPGLTAHEVEVRVRMRRRGGLEEGLSEALGALVARLSEEGPPFDLVHVNVRAHNTVPGLAIARELGVPLVYTEHWSRYNAGFDLLPEGERDEVRSAMRDWLNAPALALALPVSEDLGRRLVETFGAPPAKVTAVPNVSADAFRYEGAGPPDGTVRLALAASWHPPKNPAVFVDALERVGAEVRSRLAIDWIGEGPALDAVRGRVDALDGVSVSFPGYLGKDALAERMRDAHLFVHPTDAENLPSVIIESLCSGTPVLSHAVGGVPELVDGSNGRLCPPGDAAALADALTRIAGGDYPFDRAAIATAALGRYSAEAVGRRIHACYLQAVGEVIG